MSPDRMKVGLLPLRACTGLNPVALWAPIRELCQMATRTVTLGAHVFDPHPRHRLFEIPIWDLKSTPGETC